MGNAYAAITNNTPFPILVLTFNHADLLYLEYRSIYSIPPGATQRCEALSSPYLKFAVIYDADAEGFFHYKMWCIKSGERVSIESCEGSRIMTIGDHHEPLADGGKVKYAYWSDFLEVVSGLRRANLDIDIDIATMPNIPPAAQQQRASRRATAGGAAGDGPPLADLASIIRAQRSSLRPSTVFEPTFPGSGEAGYDEGATERAAFRAPPVSLDALDLHEAKGPNQSDADLLASADERSSSQREAAMYAYVPASLPSRSVHTEGAGGPGAATAARRGSEGLAPHTGTSRQLARVVGPRRSSGVGGAARAAATAASQEHSEPAS